MYHHSHPSFLILVPRSLADSSNHPCPKTACMNAHSSKCEEQTCRRLPCLKVKRTGVLACRCSLKFSYTPWKSKPRIWSLRLSYTGWFLVSFLAPSFATLRSGVSTNDPKLNLFQQWNPFLWGRPLEATHHILPKEWKARTLPVFVGCGMGFYYTSII